MESAARFDEIYKREVLEPARKAGDQPPEDLRVRYQLREPLSAQEVAARVRQVRQCWRRSRGQLKYRRLVDRLEADHRELAPIFASAESGDLRPLTARLRGGDERGARRRAEAKARLLDAAGAVRLLAPADVEAIARSTGVARDELESLAKVEGVAVREPDPLPLTPPYQGYPKARESLGVLGRRHLADFLFGGPTAGPMRVLDGFAAPGVRLDASAVRAVSAQWARRTRDTSSTNADTVLVMLKQCDRLDDLLLYDIVDRLRERHRQRASERALLRHAVDDLGIDAGDARRLVFSIVRESGPAGGLAGRLRELLDSGRVHAAAVLAETVSDDGHGSEGSHGPGDAADTGADEEVRLAAEEARRRVAAAARLRDEALALIGAAGGGSSGDAAIPGPGRPDLVGGTGTSGPAGTADPDRAWRLLTEALRLVHDLPGAEDARRRIPPAPVAEVRAVPEYRSADARVRLTWTESPSTAGDLVYQVVRRRGRPPHDAADGTPVGGSGQAGGHGQAGAAPGARDDDPPVNVPVYYGVAVRRDDAASVPTVVGPVFVRPEPYDVELTTSDGLVTGRWRCPAEAARILVTREEPPVAPAGEPPGAGRGSAPGGGPVIVSADRAGMRDRVANGRTYHYRICAVYLGMDGREVITPGLRLSATPSAPPDPIPLLVLAPDPRDAGRVNAVFDPPVNGTAEIVLLPEPPPWPYGTTITVAELRRRSRRIPTTTTATGLAVRPGQSGVLLAVTVAGENAIVGAHESHVNLPPPDGLVAERRGGLLNVGFDWPSDVAEVEVAYRIGAGSPRRMPVGRAAYDSHGGVRIEAPEHEPVTVTVAAAGVTAGRRVLGRAVSTTVAPRGLVHYDIERTGPPWRRELAITLTPEHAKGVPAAKAEAGGSDDGGDGGDSGTNGDAPAAAPPAPRIGRLVLVLRAGQVMPQRPDDGETVWSWSDLVLTGPVTLKAPAPRRPGPYWLRCFVDDAPVTADDGARAHGTVRHVRPADAGRAGERAPGGRPGGVELSDPPVRRLQVKG